MIELKETESMKMRLEQASLVCGMNTVLMLGCGVEKNWE
jgi:hypothetical protein